MTAQWQLYDCIYVWMEVIISLPPSHHAQEKRAKKARFSPHSRMTDAERLKKESKPAASASGQNHDEENGENSEGEIPNPSLPNPNTPSGFDKNLIAEDILGATEVEGHILFLIKWCLTLPPNFNSFPSPLAKRYILNQNAWNRIPFLVNFGTKVASYHAIERGQSETFVP